MEKYKILISSEDQWVAVLDKLFAYNYHWLSGSRDYNTSYFVKGRSYLLINEAGKSIVHGTLITDDDLVLTGDEFLSGFVEPRPYALTKRLMETGQYVKTVLQNGSTATYCITNNNKGKGIMSSIVKKLKDLALSEEDALLREYGFEDENGKMTQQAKDMMLEEMLQNKWNKRKEDVAAGLKKIKATK
jgi:hypothetical protein